MDSSLILSKSWSSCPSQLCEIRKSITAACKEMSYSTEETNLIVLAIDEACTNIMRYAYNNCTSGEILVEVEATQYQAIFRLHDYAKKVSDDCIKIKKSSPLKPGGLGLSLMKDVMNSVHFIHTEACAGNILEMKKDLPRKEF